MRFHDVNITVQQPNGNWIECNFEDDLLPVEENRYYPCLRGLPLLNVPTTSILVSEVNNLMSYGPVNYYTLLFIGNLHGHLFICKVVERINTVG